MKNALPCARVRIYIFVFFLSVCLVTHAVATASPGEGEPPVIISFKINDGNPVTNLHQVSLNLGIDGDPGSMQVRFANEGEGWCQWEAFRAEKDWILPVGDGPRLVSVQVRDENDRTAEAIAAVVINLPVEAVSLSEEQLQMTAGGPSVLLEATVRPVDATDRHLLWYSSDESVATVKEGKVTAAGEGEAIITAIAGGHTATCAVTVEAAPPVAGAVALLQEEISYGDVNGDGKAGVLDAVMVLRHTVDLLELDQGQKAAGDVNQDGKVNVADAIAILQYAAGLVDELPVDPPPDDPDEPDDPNGPDGPQPLPHAPPYIPPTSRLLDTVYRVQGVATVEVNSLNVRSGPGRSYNTLGSLARGARVTVYEEVTGNDPDYPRWYRIRYDGQDGYIATDYASLANHLYGLCYYGNLVRLAVPPEGLTPGDYEIDSSYGFHRREGGGLVDTGIQFYFLEQIPYAVLYLERPADSAVTASFLNQRAASIRPDSPFDELGEAFIRAQETWGVNALYLMANAALESAWGTSAIARDKNNIFGFMAYDHDPHGSAAEFRSMDDCIMHVSGYIRREYHTPGGRWHNGAHLVGMNVRYATDTMWAIKIAAVMQSIYPYSGYEHVEKYSELGAAAADLHLHSQPSSGSDSLAVIPAGSEFALKGLPPSAQSYWFRAVYDDTEGWCPGQNVELVTSPRASVFLPGWYKEGNEDLTLNVRGGPGTGYNIEDWLNFGASFEILEMVMASDGYVWNRIAYPGSSEQSWVRGDYITVAW